MELLYFICGILSVGITYAVVLLKKNQSNYHDALARLQHHQNISSIRSGDMKEKIKYVEDTMIDIQSNMEKDQYKNLSKINKQLSDINDRVEFNSKKIDDSTDNVDLLLVRDNLHITISLNHFLQLCNAVQTVMAKKFGLKSIYPN